MLHVGVDLHKRQAQVAVVDEEGQVLSNCRVACDQESMRGFFEQLGEPAQVVMEATSNWYWLCDLLEEMEIPVSLSHPLKTKAIASARIKTDKIDAATLAQLLRGDLLPRAHLSSPQARLDRELLRNRAMLVRMRTSTKNRIHALLAKLNLVFGEGGLFTQKGKRWLAGLALHPVYRSSLDRLLKVTEVLGGLIEEASAQIEVRAEHDAAAQLLCSIHGVGYYSALLILAEIDGVERFPDARHLCSYGGLVPSVRASAGHVRLGHITKQGSPWLRWILTEVSQKAGSRDDFLGEHYRRVARRKGKGAAKVATARKLLKAIYWMLKNGQHFSQVCDHMTAAAQRASS
jgi:transposase